MTQLSDERIAEIEAEYLEVQKLPVNQYMAARYLGLMETIPELLFERRGLLKENEQLAKELDESVIRRAAIVEEYLKLRAELDEAQRHWDKSHRENTALKEEEVERLKASIGEAIAGGLLANDHKERVLESLEKATTRAETAEAKIGKLRETEKKLRKVIDTIIEVQHVLDADLRLALEQPGNNISGLKLWAQANCICEDIDSGASKAHSCPGCDVLILVGLWEPPPRCGGDDTHCPRCGAEYQPKWNGQCANCTAVEDPRAILDKKAEE